MNLDAVCDRRSRDHDGAPRATPPTSRQRRNNITVKSSNQAEQAALASESETPRLGYVPSLDGLRAAAVVAVVGSHSGLPFFSGGDVGVDMFFVLSGFLITTLILEEQQRFGRLNVKRFWIRRLIRLTPPLLVVIALVTAARFAFGVDTEIAAQEATYAATYSTNLRTVFAGGYSDQAVMYFRHTWSLAIEEQFYLLWPVLLMWANSFSRRRMLQIIGLAYPLLALAGRMVASWSNHPDLMQFPLFRFEGFGVGLAAAFFVRSRPAAVRSRVFNPRLGAVALGFLLVEALAGEPWRWRFETVPFVGLDVLATGALILCILSSESWLRHLFSLRPLVYVGKLSYSLYLWHYPVFAYLSRDRFPATPLPLLAAAKFGCASLAALGSYQFIERSLEPVRNRFRPIDSASGQITQVADGVQIVSNRS